MEPLQQAGTSLSILTPLKHNYTLLGTSFVVATHIPRRQVVTSRMSRLESWRHTYPILDVRGMCVATTLGETFSTSPLVAVATATRGDVIRAIRRSTATSGDVKSFENERIRHIYTLFLDETTHLHAISRRNNTFTRYF